MNDKTQTKQLGGSTSKHTPNWMRGLRRPEVWSVFIAAFALLFSQFPPVLSWWKGTSIRVSAADMGTLGTEFVGHPYIIVHLAAQNTGGRSATIERFTCRLTQKDTGRVWDMPVSSILRPGQFGGQMNSYPLGWISLEEGEVWNELIRCGAIPTGDDQSAYAQLAADFNEYIQNRMRGQSLNVYQPVEASDYLENRAKEMFNGRFDFTSGPYELAVSVMLNGNEEESMTRDFFLQQFEINELRRVVDDFKIGGGVIAPTMRGRTSFLFSTREPKKVLHSDS